MKISKTHSIIFMIGICLIGGVYLYLHRYTEMSHLTSEDLKWIQSCTANDTIIFTNSKSDLADTLIVESSSAENKKCQFNFSPFCWRNKYTAQGLVEINIIHKGLLYDGNDLFI